jgi:hypothetical protein
MVLLPTVCIGMCILRFKKRAENDIDTGDRLCDVARFVRFAECVFAKVALIELASE